MQIEINIEDYITEEEKKEMVLNAYRNAIYEKMGYMKEDEFLANVGYEVIFKAVDEMLGEDSRKIIEEKVKELIGNFSSFEVFRSSDYGNPSKGYLMIEEAVESNRELINKRVKSLITEMSDKSFKYKIEDMLNEEIHKAIFGEEEYL